MKEPFNQLWRTAHEKYFAECTASPVPYAGMIQIRFEGYVLSPALRWDTPTDTKHLWLSKKPYYKNLKIIKIKVKVQADKTFSKFSLHCGYSHQIVFKNSLHQFRNRIQIPI